MKRKILLVSALVICMAVSITGTLAYYQAETQAHNVITTGSVDIRLQGWADEEKTVPFKNPDGIMPGTSVTKIAEVKNTGKSDAWVRVRINTTVTRKISDNESVLLDASGIGLNLNETSWVKNGDSYYYQKALAPGETTEPLLRSVSFNQTMGNDYAGVQVDVCLKAEAVQSANNGQTVFEAAGWPDETSGQQQTQESQTLNP